MEFKSIFTFLEIHFCIAINYHELALLLILAVRWEKDYWKNQGLAHLEYAGTILFVMLFVT